MIQMPRRSVTRFFIPLIDVLLLLFCIFLLMPQFKEEDDKKAFSAADLADSLASLEYENERLSGDIKKYDELRSSLDELEKLRAEVDRLRKERKQTVQRTHFRILDIDGKTGDIYFYDSSKPDQPKVKIGTDKEATALIERHQNEAQGSEVYYYFLYPRPEADFPTPGQERRYKAWFAGVANSFKEPSP